MNVDEKYLGCPTKSWRMAVVWGLNHTAGNKHIIHITQNMLEHVSLGSCLIKLLFKMQVLQNLSAANEILFVNQGRDVGTNNG